MLETFSKSIDPASIRRTYWACALSDAPVGSIEELLQLAAKSGSGDRVLTFRERGLIAFRAGDWQNSLKWCAESRGATQRNDYIAHNLLIEAMALFRLGLTTKAEAALVQAEETADRAFSQRYGGQARGEFVPGWIDYVVYEVLHREAELLLRPTTTHDTSSEMNSRKSTDTN
jgi:hypothetical protein